MRARQVVRVPCKTYHQGTVGTAGRVSKTLHSQMRNSRLECEEPKLEHQATPSAGDSMAQ